MSKRASALAWLAIAMLLPPPMSVAADGAEPQASTGLWDRKALSGDWAGIRPRLSDHGITLGLNYVGELFTVPSGGIHRGSVYEDLILLTGDLDLTKLGLDNGQIHFKAFRINDGGPSGKLAGNDLDISTIEVARQRQTRLFSLWYERSLWDGLLSLRIGQLAAAEEFMDSPTGDNLFNTAFSFNAFSYSHLRSVYPLSSPGLRLRLDPSDELSWLGAMFSHRGGTPNRGLVDTKVNYGGAFIISELQYKIGQGVKGLPAAYKLGGWYDTGHFDDPYLNTQGAPLPVFGGTPQRHTGDWSVYVMGDQTIWRSASGQTLTPFLLIGIAPPSFNLVTFYTDAGIGWKGALPGRPDDVLTVGVGYASVGGAVKDLDRASRLPVRNAEAVVELDYLIQLAPWWTVQPDFQYVIRPNFGSAPPASTNPTATIPNATVFGLRTTITF